MYCHPRLMHRLFQLQSTSSNPKESKKIVKKTKSPPFDFVFSRETWNLMIWDGLVQQTENSCFIRRMEYPEFQTGIFGRMESALGRSDCNPIMQDKKAYSYYTMLI